jgi:colanic acid/amylovoran biosynthesis glycosyltransferase
MLTVAYLANQFPSAVEPYVTAEIKELRRRGIRVITGSVRKQREAGQAAAQIVLQPLSMFLLLRGLWLCVCRFGRISSLVKRILFHGKEGPIQRAKALAQTWMGACYAVRLKGRAVDHIHVHHGYFGSWIAMTAARLLNISFSLTLHGSDLLLRRTFLDVKLANCDFCITISEYNRQHILESYPRLKPQKIVVSRLGVEVPENHFRFFVRPQRSSADLSLLAVGRLHEVKDHAFLIRACAQLEERGVSFECSIAGDGPQRRKLASFIRKLSLAERVTLLGQVAREQMDSLYDRADVVVLTSRSEGIPLVLMEAMARGKIVLAPAITGIPELVVHRKTGFLYEPGSMEDFIEWLLFIHSLLQAKSQADHSNHPQPERHPLFSSAAKHLDWVKHAARVQVSRNFHRVTNLELFGDLFLSRIATRSETLHENSVLQQVQLPVQRDRGLPLRANGSNAHAGARSSPVFHGRSTG